jgi:esterase/lipase superfamily enzyme
VIMLRALIWLALATSLAAAPICGVVRAQGSDEIDTLNRQVATLNSQGKYAEAIPLAERYADLARRRYGEDDLAFATAITWLGCLYQSQHRYAEAEPLLKRALSVRENTLGPAHAQVATSLANLAVLYKIQGRDAEAEPLSRRALSIWENGQGSDELDALNRQIAALYSNGKYMEAIPLAERYVGLARGRYGEEHPEYARAITWQGLLYEAQRRDAEAEPLLMRAAELYWSLGLTAEAKPLYARARAMQERLALSKTKPKTMPDISKPKTMPDMESRRPWAAPEEKMAREPRPGVELSPAPLPQVPQGTAAPQQTYAVVKVYYATNRNKSSDTEPSKIYGSERGQLAFGVCDVSIPRQHQKGELEAPSVLHFEWSEDPESHVVLLSVTERERSSFFEEVAGRIRQSTGKNAFVFVHGYNVTFADAARRTAQIAYDLRFDGAPLFFSWPSRATYEDYIHDGESARWSEVDLETFLRDFADQSDAENIFLIAHSMGARVLTGALEKLVVKSPAARQKVKEIILAAPDIDAATFKRDIAPRILASERSATLYASSRDYALKASKKFAGYRRVGDAEGGVTIIDGLDTIDASTVGTDLVGHSYYAASVLLEDIRTIFFNRKRAEERSGLTVVNSTAGRYWAFSPR